MRNCENCKYEPIWESEGVNTSGIIFLIGKCRFPVPFWVQGFPLIATDQQPDNCPAWEAR